jgi:protein gp37
VTNWGKPLLWARKAVMKGVHRRVFCASLADVFDAEVPQDWRDDLWQLITDTLAIKNSDDPLEGGLEWLILTKRPLNITQMIPSYWLANPPKGVRIGVTVEHQNNLHRIEDLLGAWLGNNFVSYEPALGPVDMKGWLYKNGLWEHGQIRVDWVIAGCESGPGRRPMNREWVRFMRDQCFAASVPFFLKQMEDDGKLVKMPLLDGKQHAEYPEA